MTRTEKVHSQYGDVEVEVVDCDSCGETIAEEDAYYFGVDQSADSALDAAQRSGYACEYCVEGPAGFPEKVIEWVLPEYEESDDLMMFIIFAPLALPLGIVFGCRSDADDFTKGYAIAGITILFYTLLGFGIWWFV